MPTALQIFGNAIRDRRKQKGLSQEELADMCDLHRTYIGSVERGERNISLMNILRLAYALEIAPEDLFQAYDKRVMAELFAG